MARSMTLLISVLSATTTLAQSTNLTLGLFPADEGGTCTASDYLTFTTNFLPPDPGTDACITLSDVFASKTSTGYRNTSYSTTSYSGALEKVNITYSLTNQDLYDPQANYSSVLYAQAYGSSSEGTPGNQDYFAYRNVFFYEGEDCTQAGDQGPVEPWFMSNCRAQGDCEQLSISIGSFRIQLPAERDDGKLKQFGGDPDKKGKCVLGAEYGAGNAVRPGTTWVLASMVGVGLWHLLA